MFVRFFHDSPVQPFLKIVDPLAAHGQEKICGLMKSNSSWVAIMPFTSAIASALTINFLLILPVTGSKGLAVNIVTGGGFQFNTKSGLRLLISINAKDRKVNTDGLQRNFIAQLAYVVRF
jgi:hypothetical protein